jgi:PAS domain S-box-containing protein
MNDHVGRQIEPSPYRLGLFLENIKTYAIFIMDRDGRVETWNPGAERLLGYRADEIIGQPFATFFIPEEIQEHIPEKELKQAAESGQACDDRWAVRKDGSRLWVSGVTVALRDSVLHGFGKIMRDHTQLIQAKEEIERLNTDLMQKVKDYEQVVGDLRASQKSLQDTVDELERFAEAVVGRELKMASLEKEVEKLRRELEQRL